MHKKLYIVALIFAISIANAMYSNRIDYYDGVSGALFGLRITIVLEIFPMLRHITKHGALFHSSNSRL